ncbi:LysR family transcriptional regulator [Xenorhabdus innexi]|uniref:LysR family transcriptional regulator n=1 Tax=Xenorhabdus innexi TaxID=290109 RepID=A0A1N6MT55_9GAMM|nr:LysR family transcriptional regulator [Xenorhabdus innexi]PHM29448.1 LysR family transcriptional regulator [Xenorhabdus innexi]SIP72038.1 putative Lysr-type transcriptional regulatory protein [Xenorhabdus innexi]
MRGMPTFRQMEYFLMAANCGSFRIAAERLHMTQPPLSRQIKELENILGGPLFTRSKAGVQLTSRGMAFHKEVPLLRKQFLEIQKKMDAFSLGEKCNWNIGFTSVHSPNIFNQIRKFLTDKLGSDSVSFTYGYSKKLSDLVSKKKLDLAIIGTPSPIPEFDYKLLHLVTERMYVAISKSHILSSKEEISLIDLKNEHLFWFQRNENKEYYDKCEYFFLSRGFNMKRKHDPGDNHILLSLISAGEGFSIVPHSITLNERSNLAYIPLVEKESEELSIKIQIIYRADIDFNNAKLITDIHRVHSGINN